MSTSKAVFLFDICAFSGIEHANLENQLKCLRLLCLRFITELSETLPNFKFGFKFFNSRGNIIQKSDKFGFSEVNLEAFENLETELSVRYERYWSLCKAVADSKNTMSCTNNSQLSNNKMSNLFNNDFNLPVKLLNLALTQILCEYEWDSLDISSPVCKKKSNSTITITKNYVFLISSSPHLHFKEYFGVTNVTANVIKGLIMPPALYQKFIKEVNIRLVWLNSTKINTNIKDEENQSINILKKAIEDLGGIFLSLHMLSGSTLCSPLFEKTFVNCELSSSTKLHNALPLINQSSLFLPFSRLLSHVEENQILTETFKNYSILELPNISITVNLISTTNYDNHMKKNISPGKMVRQNANNNISNSLHWRKLSSDYTIDHGFYGAPEFSYICITDCKEQSILFELSKFLILRKQNLVLKCETKNGITGLGILTPSLGSCFISIFTFTPLLLNISLNKTVKRTNLKDLSLFIDSEKDQIKSLEDHNEGISDSSEPCKRNFEMASLERWFQPSLKPTNFNSDLSFSNNYDSTKTVLMKLRKHYDVKEDLSATPKLTELSTLNCRDLSPPKLESEKDFCTFRQENDIPCLEISGFTNEEQVVNHLQAKYNSALLTKEDLIPVCQIIMKTVFEYFQSKTPNKTNKNIISFMNEHFLISVSKISEKYSKESDLQQKIREYQMQVLLNFELEMKLPSSSETCLKTVIALLRALNFIVSPVELSYFLRDVIVVNYGDSLHHLLLEIGDELNIPILPDLFSPSSTSENDSPVVRSSTLSHNSLSSSNSSQRSVKNLSLSRRSFSGTFSNSQNRQIVIPKKLKKQNSNQGNDSLRRSPRLALKRNSEEILKTHNIRRNLFNSKSVKRHKSPTPEKNNYKRQKVTTPKGHHILKTNFVPETPSPKQGTSLKRRIQRLERSKVSFGDVLESPPSNVKNDLISTLHSLENPSKLNGSFYGSSQKNSSSFCVSKNIKVEPSHLFAELLDSPSIKQCSKRLFTSPEASPPVTPLKSILKRTPSKSLVNEQSMTNKSDQEIQETPKKIFEHASTIASSKRKRFSSLHSFSKKFNSNQSNSNDFIAKNNTETLTELEISQQSSKLNISKTGQNELNSPFKTPEIRPSTSKRVFSNQYTPPTANSLLHLTTSPVVFIQKKRKL